MKKDHIMMILKSAIKDGDASRDNLERLAESILQYSPAPEVILVSADEEESQEYSKKKGSHNK